MTRRLPTLTDFNCAHPGCGAIKGFRCIYSGYTHGHPIRRQRVLSALDRMIRHCSSPTQRAEMLAHRATLTGADLELAA